MRRLPIFSMRGSRAVACLLLVLLAGCAAPQERVITITRAEPVPYPTRPNFTPLQDGDVACMGYAARMRLGQRHTQVVWYMRELEGALKAYDAQANAQAAGGSHD